MPRAELLRETGNDDVSIRMLEYPDGSIHYWEKNLITNKSKQLKEQDFVASFNDQHSGLSAELAPSTYAQEATHLSILDHPDVLEALQSKEDDYQHTLLEKDTKNQAKIQEVLDNLQQQHQEQMDAINQQHRQLMDTITSQQQAEVDAAQARFDDLQDQLSDAQAQIEQLQQTPQTQQQNQGRFSKLMNLGKTLIRPNTTQSPVQPENDALETHNPTEIVNFQVASSNLIKLTDRRKARSFFQIRNRRAETQNYVTGLEIYAQELQNILQQRHDVAEQAGVDGGDIEIAQRAFVYNQRLDLAMASREYSDSKVQQVIDNGGMRGRWAQGLRLWANQPTWRKALIGAGVGVGAGVVASAAVGVGLFGVAIGSAAKMSVRYVNNRANIRNVTETNLQAELNRIERARHEAHAKNIGQAALENLVIIQETNETNRQRRVNTLGAAAMLLGGVTLAAGAAELIGINLPDIDMFGSDKPKIDIPRTQQLPPNHIHDNNNLHSSYYGFGHEAGIKSTSSLKMVGYPGHYSLVDKSGTVIVKHMQWERDGDLTYDTRNAVKHFGYAIKQLNPKRSGNGHYMTEILSK